MGAIVDRVLVCGEKTTTRKWLTLAERWLAADPTSVSGFRMLGEAARAVELMRRTSIAQTVTEESCGDEGTFRRKVKTGSGATAYSRNSS